MELKTLCCFFRKKILNFGYLLVILNLLPALSYAFSWTDLWLTANQQGAKLLAKDKPKEAALKFSDKQWQAVAQYRAKNYQAAAKGFAFQNTAVANYNRGNALAYLGKFQPAIEAYDMALKEDPNFKDAIHNKKVLQQLLQQQSQQQQNSLTSQQQNSDTNSQQQRSQQNDNPKGDKQTKNNQQSANQPPKSQADSRQNNSNSPQSQPHSAEQNNSQQKQDADQNQQPQLTAEQQQNLKQWLQQIPDDPGGLLRRKFLRDHLRMQEQEG